MKFKLILFVYFLLIIQGCTTQKKDKNKIEELTLFLSRSGANIEKIVGDEFIIHSDLDDELYEYKLINKKKLVISFGYGEYRSNDINMSVVKKSDTILLSKNQFNKIESFIKSIYNDKPYITKENPLDSWLVKLKINDQTYCYYIGEVCDKLNPSYKKIVDYLVRLSPYKINEY